MTPYLRAANVTWSGLDLSDVKQMNFRPEEQATYALHPGDILMSEASGSAREVGKPAIWAGEIPGCCFQNTLIRVRPPTGMTRFLYYHLLRDAILGRFVDHSKGVGIHHLGAERLSILEMWVAPLREQARIVSGIEQHLSDIDAGVTALDRVLANLKRYRAAVLKAAGEGRLVQIEAQLARTENRDYEPASALLARILKERRARWEQEQLAKMRATGRMPRDDRWKARYVEPASPDTSALPELPEGWCWAELGQLVSSVKDGPHYSPKYADDPDSIPFITGGNVRPDGVDFDGAKRISRDLHDELCKRVRPAVGDILYTKGGTTGIARVNTYAREFSVWVHVAVLKLVGFIEPFYIQHALNSPFCYAQAQRYTHGVGNQDLGLTRMIHIVLAVPPLAEQTRIVGEVDRLLSIADETQHAVRAQLARADRLRRALLERAFNGKLVPQDPSDEPASALLARIAAAKKNVEPVKPPKRGRRRREPPTSEAG